MNQEVKTCQNCKKDFTIEPDDFSFYKKELIPVPHRCPDCRYKQRFSLRPERKLYHRACMCDLKNHFHGGIHCIEEFETSYSSSTIEKVYCKQCYQSEVL